MEADTEADTAEGRPVAPAATIVTMSTAKCFVPKDSFVQQVQFVLQRAFSIKIPSARITTMGSQDSSV